MSSLGQISINNVLLHEVNADPRTGSGVASDVGDIAIATDGSGVYQKIGASDTDWQLMIGTAQSANQHATNSAVSDVVIQSPSANRILNAIGNNVRCQISSTGVGIGFSTNDQAASALLEMRSTTQGFLPPRMTTAQRQAISSPANGLVVYDTSLNALCRYEENTWRYSIYRVLSTTVTTTSTAYTNVSGEFSFNLETGRYLLTMHGHIQSSDTSTGGGSLRLVNDTSTISFMSIDWFITQGANSTSRFYQAMQTSPTSAYNSTSANVTTPTTFFATGVFVVSSAGLNHIQLRARTTSASFSILANSTLRIERIGDS